MKQKLAKIWGETDNSKIIIGDFNPIVSIMNRKARHKIKGYQGGLPWRIPWTEGPGRLQSIGLQRAGHNGSDLAGAQIID